MIENLLPRNSCTVLESPPNRKRCLLRNKYFLTIVLLVVATNIAGVFYILSKGLFARLKFPKGSNQETSEVWIHRAIIYNVEFNPHFQAKKLDIARRHDRPISDHKLVCYYQFPTENATGVLLPDRIDANLCTHINIGFAIVVNNTILINDYQLNVTRALLKLKQLNKNLKVLISVGGAGNGSGFAQMVTNHPQRKQFIKSILYYVKNYEFDGVDLDWEFPNENPGNDTYQRMHFTQLLHEIRNEINRQEKHKFILSVAVAAPVFLVDNSYDVDYINQYVDYINLMSYDYHYYTDFTPFTGINSPLYSPQSDIGYFATLNMNYSANYWISKGMDRDKIIIGLPTYGHSFTLRNILNNGLNAPASGNGKLGQNGFIDYTEVCQFLTMNQIVPVFDNITKSPYATKYTEWISFDDLQSLTYKADYIKNNYFGGAMVFSLNADDHKGVCHRSNRSKEVAFPLTKIIKSVLISNNK